MGLGGLSIHWDTSLVVSRVQPMRRPSMPKLGFPRRSDVDWLVRFCVLSPAFVFSQHPSLLTKGDFRVFVAVRMCACYGTPSSIFKGANVLGTSRSIVFIQL